MNNYRYPISIQFLGWILFIIYIYFVISIVISIGTLIIQEPLKENTLYKLLTIVPIGFVLIYSFFHFSLNSYAPIQTSPEGFSILLFDFRFYWKFIPWNDIVSIGEYSYFVAKGPTSTNFYLKTVIQTKKLPLFHRLRGYFYTRKFIPCIEIAPDINNYINLIKTLESNSTKKIK